MSRSIPLSKGQFAIVDDEDFDWLSQWKWCALEIKNGNFYAVRHERCRNRKLIYMHRSILDQPQLCTDHINGNTLDNQRSNLRAATQRQNAKNQQKRANTTSRYKGVSWSAATQRWVAAIGVDYRVIALGRFGTEIDAARAYDHAARLHFGEFARLNFPEENAP